MRLLEFLLLCGLAGLISSSGLSAQQNNQNGRGPDRQQQRRSRWDPSGFLQRLDRNGNKILEPDEMSGRAQGFIQNMGIDTSSPVAIDKIIEKINRDRSEQEKEQTGRTSNAKKDSTVHLVREFGEDVHLPPVPGFGTDIDSKANLLNVNAGLASTRDGQRGDSNGGDDNRGDARRNGTESESRPFSNRSASFRSFSNSGETPTRNSSVRPSSLASSVSVTSSPSDRIASYVSGQLKKYDKNYNGYLDEDELKEMSNPPKGADKDNDSRLSRQELEDYYNGGYRHADSSESSTVRTSAESDPDRSRDQRQGPPEFRRRDNRGSRSSFASSYDGTSSLLMRDFEPDTPWSEEKIKRFYAIDTNRDGVITPEEFRNAK